MHAQPVVLRLILRPNFTEKRCSALTSHYFDYGQIGSRRGSPLYRRIPILPLCSLCLLSGLDGPAGATAPFKSFHEVMTLITLQQVVNKYLMLCVAGCYYNWKQTCKWTPFSYVEDHRDLGYIEVFYEWGWVLTTELRSFLPLSPFYTHNANQKETCYVIKPCSMALLSLLDVTTSRHFSNFQRACFILRKWEFLYNHRTPDSAFTRDICTDRCYMVSFIAFPRELRPWHCTKCQSQSFDVMVLH